MTSSNNISQRGFTLIELIISMVIISIIAATMSKFLVGGGKSLNQIQDRKTITQTNSVGIAQIETELNFAHRIISANFKNIQFTTTFDTNIVVNYQLNNIGTITRQVDNGNQQLINQYIDYNNSYLNYFDSSGNQGSPIRRIRLSVVYILNNYSSRYTIDVTPISFKNT